ncbi:hypothetical protein GCM10025874_17430 [Arenivirga flava]|uniref:DUF3592 domain-containing protein n=1 Tax=Arenivirga flava TaxID=1930060 RepID=A0AA37UKI3_9MICO|nr:hypothetical protein GCM10025874_17430 [Arenivirga flava]
MWTVLGTIAVLIGAAVVVVVLSGIGGEIEERSEASERSYFVEHGAEAVGTPIAIEENERASRPRYRGNVREYALVYSYTRADGSTGEVRGPWSQLEFELELDLEAGTTATVRYLDDAPEHGDRAGGAIVLDDGSGPAIPTIEPIDPD